jgi:1-pyrroline-5-carboxylate dehydrogenase
VSLPKNEPIFDYRVGSAERAALKKELTHQAGQTVEIPCMINGQAVHTGNTVDVVMPHLHAHVLGKLHLAGQKELELAMRGAMQAKPMWEALGFESRLRIFEKAADLLSGPWRARINAATMLGQSKNCFQAEVDAACEMADFFRFNAEFYRRILTDQPISAPTQHNSVEYRALDGFIAAIAPFNFTAISGNLATAPAMAGNVVLWKPSETQSLSAYLTYQMLVEAGLPPGVIQFVPSLGSVAAESIFASSHLSGVHFTGSTKTFESIISTVGSRIGHYESYPRIVGETGGKGFVFAHASADPDALRVALIRGAFEYQGQKCSAASRAYIPESLWKTMRDDLVSEVSAIRMGDVRDFRNLMGAVIDGRAHTKIRDYIDYAKNDASYKLLSGGEADASEGFYVRPTIFESPDPRSRLMSEEIFGPVLTVHVYPDAEIDSMLKVCNNTSPYALTGAILAQERGVIEKLSHALRYAAGNFYINDKPTGAVVGQQPFGGARKSGTNDKAGSALNLTRWLSARTVKETFISAKSVGYPHMEAE